MWKPVLLGGLAGGLLAATIAVAVETGNGRSGGSRPDTRFSRMIDSGEMDDLFDQHWQMLEQMRVGVTPAMVELMANDPMWQMLRDGDLIQMMEENQEQVDRMLGLDG